MVSGRGANLGTATLSLRADRARLKKDIDAAEKMTKDRISRFEKRAKAAGAMAAGIGASLTLPLAHSVRTFARFEQSMARVRATTAGITNNEFADLTSLAQRMGATTAFTATQAADALGFMSMAGMEASEQIAALPPLLDLASAGQLDLADSADIVTNIMSGYGIASADVGRATDVLVTGFISANTNLLQLGEAFKYAGPLAKVAGLRFEEAAAALSLMGNAGIQASMAGTSLRGGLVRLLDPPAAAADAMRRLGVTALDASGQLLPLADIMLQFETVGLGAADAMRIFGLRAGPAFLALMGEGSEALRQLTAEMDASAGTAERIRKQQLDTLQGSVVQLTSAMDGLALTIGSSLAPTIRAVADFITPIIQGWTQWSRQNRTLAAAIVTVVGILGILMLVGGLSLLMAGAMAAAWGVLGLSLSSVAAAAATAWLALTGPVGWVIAGIVAVIAVVTALYKRFEAVRDIVDKVTFGIFRMNDAATQTETIQAPLGSPTAPVAPPQVEAIGEELEKVTSSLSTGQTRWLNREIREQENATDRIVEALESQTKTLVDDLKLNPEDLIFEFDPPPPSETPGGGVGKYPSWLNPANWTMPNWMDPKTWASPNWANPVTWLTPTWMNPVTWIAPSWINSGSWTAPTWLNPANWTMPNWMDPKTWASPNWANPGTWLMPTWMNPLTWATPSWISTKDWNMPSWLDTSKWTSPDWLSPKNPATWLMPTWMNPTTWTRPDWLNPANWSIPTWLNPANWKMPSWLNPANWKMPSWLNPANWSMPTWLNPANWSVPSWLNPANWSMPSWLNPLNWIRPGWLNPLNWIRPGWLNPLNWIRPGWLNPLNWIRPGWFNPLNWIRPGWFNPLNWIRPGWFNPLNWIRPGWFNPLNWIRPGWLNPLNWIRPGWFNPLNWIRPGWFNPLNWIRPGWFNPLNWIRPGWLNPLNWIRPGWFNPLNWIRPGWFNPLNWIRPGWFNPLNWIRPGWFNPLNWIRPGWLNPLNWIRPGWFNPLNWPLPRWIPFRWPKLPTFRWPPLPSLKISWPKINKAAEGGIAMSPQILEVAEAGEPEALIPLSRLDSMLSGAGAGGGGVQIFVEGNVLDGEQLWDIINNGLRQSRRGGGSLAL